ncbi:MAG: flagellar hook capping family protein [Alphaproteobacteria bacterium]|nr:flagellar hook capping family protein [Alphaproteobacteria bacterium]
MTSDVTITGAGYNAQKTETAGLKLAEDFTQFLTLLTTQLQNQDPLNPMDSTEFTNQLVQFTQVEQAINTNQKLDNMVQMQLGAMAGMALGYVGMDVTYPSAELAYDGENKSKITYALAEEAYEAKINIRDENGIVVHTALVSRETGTKHYEWDGTMNGGSGKAEAGTYSFTIDAVSGAGTSVAVSTAVNGRVRGVETQNGVPYLLIGERAVPVGNVINAVVPKVVAADPVPDPETPPEDDTEA